VPKGWEGTPEQWRFATPYAGREEKWKYLDQCLRMGRRGLPGGSSLHNILRELKQRPETVSERQIRIWAKAFFKDTDRWPTKHDQNSLRYSTYDITWHGWDRALQRGWYGLPGGSSLSELVAPLRRGSQKAGRPDAKTETEAILSALRDGLQVLGISEEDVLQAAKKDEVGG
jgi:hypothetical protein